MESEEIVEILRNELHDLLRQGYSLEALLPLSQQLDSEIVKVMNQNIHMKKMQNEYGTSNSMSIHSY